MFVHNLGTDVGIFYKSGQLVKLSRKMNLSL